MEDLVKKNFSLGTPKKLIGMQLCQFSGSEFIYRLP